MTSSREEGPGAGAMFDAGGASSATGGGDAGPGQSVRVPSYFPEPELR